MVYYVSHRQKDLTAPYVLCLQLLKSRTGLTRTDTMLRSLIQSVVGTGCATGNGIEISVGQFSPRTYCVASVATIELALFLGFKDNYYHFTPALVLSKLYSNSLMVVLNNRQKLRNIPSTPNGLVSLNGANFGQVMSRERSGAININVAQSTYTDNIAMVNLEQIGKETEVWQ